MEPLLQSQLIEAGRAGEERPATSRLVEGIRKLVFGGHQRYLSSSATPTLHT